MPRPYSCSCGLARCCVHALSRCTHQSHHHVCAHPSNLLINASATRLSGKEDNGVDYDLDRLGWREMEHLTGALAVRIIGNGVTVFGDGADGGREAAFHGQVDYPVPDPDGLWDGYGVIQVKHRTRSRSRVNNADWLKGQIKQEVADWQSPQSKRGPLPEYLLVVTNVDLTPKPTDGGWAKVTDFMNTEVTPALGLKGWRVWDYRQLCTFLDAAGDIAGRYYGLIAPGDVLARLHEYVTGLGAELGDTLLSHTAKELLAEQHVNLAQAGDHEDHALSLNHVAVDLPAQVGAADVKVIKHVIQRGDEELRRSASDKRSGLVVLGGPGQGKTTLAQLICQTYRVAQLKDLPNHRLLPKVRAVCDGFAGDLIGRLGFELPVMRRWPFHVRLDRYADAVTRDQDLTLLRYMANRITRTAAGTVTDSQLLLWLSKWPWVVVLDGLDEVSDPKARELLLAHVDHFRIEAAQCEADLLLVATTRAQGYAAEFPPDEFEELLLRPLQPDEAVEYAELLAAARHPNNAEKRDEMLHRIRDAAQEPQTSRLMRSPLQVTIMALLLERRRRAPNDRFGLFSGYYDTVYAREVAKDTHDATLLERNRTHIDALQARAGLLLQTRSEREGDAQATLTDQDLRGLSARLLREEGHDEGIVDALSTSLVELATRRLVLLVHQTGGIGFEVRSLQEFMAARALVSRNDTDAVACLGTIAPSAHWRTTWLFAASEIFAARPQLRGTLLNDMRAVDNVDKVSMAVLPASHLAIDLIEENIAEDSPRFQALLVGDALRLLSRLPDLHLLRLAEVLAELVERSPSVEERIVREVTDALSTAGPPALAALTACAVWANGSGRLAERARAWLQREQDRLLRTDPAWRTAVASLAASFPFAQLRPFELTDLASREQRTITEFLERLPDDASLRPSEVPLARQLAAILGRITVARSHWAKGGLDVVRADRLHRPDLVELSEALGHHRVAAALVEAADEIELVDWPVAGVLRRVLVLWSQRRPVGHLLPEPDVSGP